MENFSGLTPEEKARLLELEKSVALDKAKPIINSNDISRTIVKSTHHTTNKKPHECGAIK